MKAYLNFEFETPQELARFMRRYLDEPQTQNIIVAGPSTTPIDIEFVAQTAAVQAAEQQAAPFRTRKPRSDAGQPRGPHKTTGEPAASEPGTGGQASAAPLTPAAPVAPTTSTPPAPTTPLAAPPSAATPLAPAGAGAVKLTEAHARAELKKISTEPGMGGTQAAIDYIKKFGVHQITKLPESMYEQFIAGVDKEIAAFRAKPKAPAAK